jgi:hypothetical protein
MRHKACCPSVHFIGKECSRKTTHVCLIVSAERELPEAIAVFLMLSDIVFFVNGQLFEFC